MFARQETEPSVVTDVVDAVRRHVPDLLAAQAIQGGKCPTELAEFTMSPEEPPRVRRTLRGRSIPIAICSAVPLALQDEA
ncbi:hypothetical protein [Salinibacter altiplanensis]|uniref:hypothetical protein n=1 Tax=Salinibacter altiplanensis TaxID=1803181 RepID=UPI000C9ED363|nr:hypothetical protein [Salinibacter altiplanensis]